MLRRFSSKRIQDNSAFSRNAVLHCDIILKFVIHGTKCVEVFRMKTHRPRCLLVWRSLFPCCRCRLAEDGGPEETRAAAAGWAGHTGQQTRRSGQGPGCPGETVSYPQILQKQTQNKKSECETETRSSAGVSLGISNPLWWVCARASAACHYISRDPPETHCRLCRVPTSLQSSCMRGSTPAWAGSLPDWRHRPPTGCQAGERLELGHSARAAPAVLPVCVYLLPAPPHDTSDLLTFALRRAEEEDEHLERTLEQNKGKMAKKEEKCVLQWLSFQKTKHNQQM